MSHGTVVGYVALFIALGTGGAWAAATIGPSDIQNNAIHTRHIQNNAVKTQKIAKGAINTSRLADSAVTGNKVATDTLKGDNIDESSLGQVPAAATARDADTAITATNASELGGVPANRYQRSCTPGTTVPGTILAHVYVKASASFSATYTDTGLLNQFNCGAPNLVRAKRVATGIYYVLFPGIDSVADPVAAGNVTVSSSGAQDNNDILTYKPLNDPAIGATVYRVETASGSGTLEDREFSFTVMG